MQYLDRLPPEAFWARYAEMEERIRATAAVLPFYGVAGWGGLVMIGDWQWENEQLVSIGLAHGAPDDESKLHVHTTVRDPTADVTSLRIAAVRPAWDDKDEMLRRLRELGTVAGESSTIAVDAAPVEFTVWGEAGRWWAAGHHDGFGLVPRCARSDQGLPALACTFRYPNLESSRLPSWAGSSLSGASDSQHARSLDGVPHGIHFRDRDRLAAISRP